MATDRVDTAREDARRADRARQETRRDEGRQVSTREFASQLQSKLKTKEIIDNQAKGEKKSGSEKDLLSRVMEVYRGKEESKEQNKREFLKRDDKQRERSQEKGESRFESRSEEGHARVAAKQSFHQPSGEGGSGGGGAQAGGGGVGGQAGGRQEASSGFSGSKDQGSFSRQMVTPHPAAKSFTVKPVAGSLADASRQGSSGRFLSPKVLDEIVESVTLYLNENRETEMEIKLSDETFAGMKMVATHSSGGVVISFVCPDKAVKTLFLVERPKILTRLKAKGIRVAALHVV